MIRAQRRPGIDEPAVITPQMALDYELTGGWPNRAEFFRFWNGSRVPAHLKHQPDPRKVLESVDRIREYEREHAAWNEARLTWLEKEAARG